APPLPPPPGRATAPAPSPPRSGAAGTARPADPATDGRGTPRTAGCPRSPGPNDPPPPRARWPQGRSSPGPYGTGGSPASPRAAPRAAARPPCSGGAAAPPARG